MKTPDHSSSFVAAAASSDSGNVAQNRIEVKGTQQGASASTDDASSESGTSEHRRRELADFLRTRREKLKPEHVGISQGTRRRTPGLRREEVAELAGVGTTWYTWLEQARDIQPSSEVLRRLGTALQLNPSEIRHLFALAGKAVPCDLDTTDEKTTPSLERILNEALQVPAILIGSRYDILSANAKAREVFTEIDNMPEGNRNWVYYIFCNPKCRADLGSSWEKHAQRILAEFRASVSQSLDHPWIAEMVDKLKADSPEFALWWRDHNVTDNPYAIIEHERPDGTKLTLERTMLRPWENPRFRILVYTKVG